MSLAGKVALVTGASRGLGATIARALGAEGAAVACMARAGAALDETSAALAASGVEAIAVPGDVTREDQVEAAVRATVDRWGGLDLVVLNAGTWLPGAIHETTVEQWDALLDLNLKGAFLVLKHAVPRLVGRGGGTVVGIASIGALVGQPGSSAYAASKYGLRGLLESAALELKPHRIRVTLVYPHMINSEARSIGPGTAERDRNLETADVAGLVVYACAAPDHVALGHVAVWPLAAGIAGTMS